MPVNFRIRPALDDDAEALTKIAHDAKRHWGYPERWITRWHDDLTITPSYVTSNRVFVAEVEGVAVGFYALVNQGERAELDHMWVAPEHIGTGVGKELFLHAMTDAASRDIGEIQITSDPHAEGFYRKMGAYRIGETISELDGQPRTLPQLAITPSKQDPRNDTNS